jgi:hypothetical protein
VARSLNHFAMETTLNSLCVVVELHVMLTIQKYSVLHNNVFMVTPCRLNNRTYAALHVKCPMFMTDFNQMWSSSAYFHIVPNTKGKVKFHPRTGHEGPEGE